MKAHNAHTSVGPSVFSTLNVPCEVESRSLGEKQKMFFPQARGPV